MKNLVNSALALILAAGLAATSTTAALAVGEQAPTTAAKECDDGLVWDEEADNEDTGEKGKCVDAADVDKPAEDKQGMIYDYGRAMAMAGHYDKAITALKSAPDRDDPRVLNYLGYSHRKLGRMDEALGYYQAAVARDPDFSLVREYLGEAYIQLGLMERAREQLSEIERICGSKACEEYGQLARLIVDSQ
ncbi:MAG: hypothetical protein BroJett030_28640 [Alphaproteobacteria bacterium]|nr:MAG: hypothetical protein BroJett030_28640 [Alphaproteobacteria bacterium]